LLRERCDDRVAVDDELMDPATRETLLGAHTSNGEGVTIATEVAVVEAPKVARSPKVRADLPIQNVVTLERKVRLVPDLRDVWSYINPYMLFGRHLGFRGDFMKQFLARDPKALELYEGMEEVKNEAAEFMKVRAVWQFFEAESEGERLHLFAPGSQEPLHTFKFPPAEAGGLFVLERLHFAGARR